MRKDIFLLMLGALVFLVPFLGVPEKWKAILLFILGVNVCIVALSYRLATRRSEREKDDVLFEDRAPLREAPSFE